MFRHPIGKESLFTNLAVASILSTVAGMVNVVGFLAIQKLTTNVTGHFAFFIEAFDRFEFWEGIIYLYYILFFLLGAFCSNLLIEWLIRTARKYAFSVPVLVEILLLSVTGLWMPELMQKNSDAIAFLLLFSMGLQNAMVTKISAANIRTTHLTGLFTDLGIELSQWFFYHSIEQKKKLSNSIKLRFTIILFFFAGGVIAGLVYSRLQGLTLILAAIILLIGLLWNSIKKLFHDH